MAAELYDLVTTMLRGETFTMAGGVGDLNGVEAWRRTYQKYNQSTPASALTALMRAMAPGRVNHQDLMAKIEGWQVQVDSLRRDHNKELSNKMRAVALVQMVP